ncbi:hypothetical protein LMH87_012326 [Akanthomyces muscarius]|uniref:Asl1-like glycosyl hydrolase catalytic domain-containing protein n=1 Tax=Akanthomyces muscarius TaxID=2231603 RepID=A0A9W8QD42_AKAMU|nr:hypothetical protein LMH87_012326 [Akanthomyces muscarius]KAJ4151637.1 hypothetical protein LMH87_012326 [Akanthomyces muscarius]
MISKTAIALPLAASLLEQVNAFSLHRHQHAADKRDNVVWHTVFETVYVTAGAESPAETQQAFVQDSQPANAANAAVVTVDATPSQAPAAAAPAPAQTTLSTAVKPALSIPGLDGILPTKASSSSAPSSTALGFAKQGIAYNDVSMAKSFGKACGERCGWYYNWGSSSGGLDSGAEYIPMLWGPLDVHTSHWDSDAEKALSNGAKAMLSFNEPDMPSQANLSPDAAAKDHAKYFSKYKGRAQIGSPAVSNSNLAGQGIKWLESFVTACSSTPDCHFDFCAVHWYADANAQNTLFDHLEKAKVACQGKAIWLTEFAPINPPTDTVAISKFIKDVIPQLDSLDYLHAYSYFMVAQPALMDSTTGLSTIGKAYAAIAN